MDHKYVIDSSVFIAFYYAGDVNHENAIKIMKSIGEQPIIINPYVICEVATVLTYKISKKVAENFLKDVLGTDINISIPNVRFESEFFILQNKKMSFTDTTLVSLAKKLNADLVTFDKQMISLFKK